ncbi:MAG: helix-turn-helix transcriptional regulator [Schwartzia sp.]|nr:helix-turn-helix transcriptional regulator [Schwartzia sp. (in: firmicutes)]
MLNENDNRQSTFSVRLRMLREHQEFSQKEAAKQLRIRPDTYGHYERGLREPDFQTLKHIANFFHVSIDYLLDNEDDIDLEAMPILDFYNFVMNGKYTIDSTFPGKDEKKLIADIARLIHSHNK